MFLSFYLLLNHQKNEHLKIPVPELIEVIHKYFESDIFLEKENYDILKNYFDNWSFYFYKLKESIENQGELFVESKFLFKELNLDFNPYILLCRDILRHLKKIIIEERERCFDMNEIFLLNNPNIDWLKIFRIHSERIENRFLVGMFLLFFGLIVESLSFQDLIALDFIEYKIDHQVVYNSPFLTSIVIQ